MRLFSEDSAKDAKFPIVPEGISEVYVKGWNDAIDAIVNNAPTVEIPKGKWIFTKYAVWQCSNCGGNPHAGTGFVPDDERMKRQWKYCNLCGADMRGGQANDPN